MKQRDMIHKSASVSLSERQNKTGMRKRVKRSLEWKLQESNQRTCTCIVRLPLS